MKLIMIEGFFIRELKNRFLCEVKIDGKVEECYVPSSCHLSNFLQLKGKRVVLIPTQGKNPRTKYALYAAPYRRNYIILNTSLSNVAIEKGIHIGDEVIPPKDSTVISAPKQYKKNHQN